MPDGDHGRGYRTPVVIPVAYGHPQHAIAPDSAPPAVATTFAASGEGVPDSLGTRIARAVARLARATTAGTVLWQSPAGWPDRCGTA